MSEGSENEGTEHEGSETEGSEHEGSENEGSENESSEHEGSESEGSETEGSDSGDSDDEGSGDEGSENEGSDQESSDGEGTRAEGSQHQPGTPAWADLGTTDSQAAVAFYAGLLGWEAENTPAGPAGTYVICRRDGREVAALYEQDEAMRSRGVPPLWLVYISVEDVSAAAQKVQEAGGTVHAQPFDVAEAGRMALVQDPTGAMFGLWEPGSRAGAQILHQPGAMDWFELATNDPEKAGEFYEQVLGWTISAEEFAGTPYTTCSLGDQPVAGILPAEALPEGVAPNWTVYFAVEDCAAAVEKAQNTGAELLSGPHEMPRVGQFAGLRDPQGAAFAIIQPTSGEDESEQEDSSGEDESDEQESQESGDKDSADTDSGEKDDEQKSEDKDSEGKSSDGEKDDAQQEGESDEKGEPNEELREKNSDSGQSQTDAEPDDSGVR